MPRATSLATLLVAVTACVYNPDPRRPAVADVERGTLGAWIIVTDRRGVETHGELLAVHDKVIRVLAWGPDEPLRPPGLTAPRSTAPGPAAFTDPPVEHPTRVAYIPRSEIARARLFRYTADSFNGWGVLGSLSTITHLILAPLTLPLWILTSAGTESAETRHVIMDYPGDRLDDFAMWARFPQGMPPGIDPRALVPPAPRGR